MVGTGQAYELGGRLQRRREGETIHFKAVMAGDFGWQGGRVFKIEEEEEEELLLLLLLLLLGYPGIH